MSPVILIPTMPINKIRTQKYIPSIEDIYSRIQVLLSLAMGEFLHNLHEIFHLLHFLTLVEKLTLLNLNPFSSDDDSYW